MKPDAVAAGHGVLADLGAQGLHGRDDVVGRRDRVHDLDELHDLGRVEEVHADDVLRAARRGGAVDDRQADEVVVARIAPGLADLVEVLEQRLLDGQVLDDGLDDEVDVGEVVERRRAASGGRAPRRGPPR